ncbi:6-O-methylguanine DNA methyltransferase [Actibacterium mucosum KCTC 23349]|uniref:methylated-DNA--[protein]-cysteine S-methyltransferase n=1 Tax=Actibacterium mucosum KCTC 23349 TaxID=1454373 RepID=A0A037ZGU8_9RHOB|nr:trifunctional transcriptional activator/DNA repair protein Ada/methylated-DNA--[protein]-cysteine S-methyltransferase [Actibacterium mucosum]KAJ54761.1 6-O-methylguanine DNA methyltransferase [Actibacterium mucosum KCTC 23349]
MLIDLPDDDTLYRALLDRDAAFDGQAFVGVRTTGIFCRLTCPARKPKRENCTFYPSPAACLQAGFRPCKRCHPMRPAADADPCINALLEALEADPAYRWTEGAVAARGFAPSTVRRVFKRQFGMTFLEIARQRRLGEGFLAMADGDKVIEAQHAAGFASASAFRDAFARLLGRAPGHMQDDALLRAHWIRSPLGDMVAISSRTHLHLLEFLERKALKTEIARLEKDTRGRIGLGRFEPSAQVQVELNEFFTGKRAQFDTPLAYSGSGFAQAVWDALRRIPAGHTRSYAQLAAQLGRPEAVRAVARANGANQIALLVPCHRVLGADGALTGYGGGLWRKQKLLEVERQYRDQPPVRSCASISALPSGS